MSIYPTKLIENKHVLILTSSAREFLQITRHFQNCRRDSLLGLTGEKLRCISVRRTDYQGFSILIIRTASRLNVINPLFAALVGYRPALVLFAGFAGGIEGISLGSVVLASEVVDLTNATSTDTGLQFKIETLPIHETLIPLLEQIKDENIWISRVLEPAETAKEAMANDTIVGTIASGFVVDESSNGDIKKALEKEGIKCFAVETESAICLATCSGNGVRYLPIRGISDLCYDKDPDTDKYRQPWAAAHASAACIEFINKYIATERDKDEREVVL